MRNFKNFAEELQPGAVPEPGREAIGGRFQSASPKKATKPAPQVTSEDTKEPTGKLKDACWTGYTAVGMKMKNGRKVPNCVPIKEAPEAGDDPTNQGTPEDLAKRGNKTVIKRFKEISEIVMPHVKNDLGTLDKTSFIKKHGLSKSAAKQKVTEAKDEQEYGYEGAMALNQLKTLVRCAEMIEELLKPDTDLPEWVQSKITLATDYIQTAADYMYSEMKEEVQIDELSNNLLGRYKTAAGADASKADKAGDYNKGNKRFGGILKATKKQFANDLRKESVTSVTNHEDEPHEIIHKKTDKVVSTHKNYKDAYSAYEKLGRGPEGMTDHAIGHIPQKKMKEEVMQEREDDEYHTPTRHHVQVQVSKGDGPKEHRKATVRAKEPSHAVSAAISHYKSQGYTVHDHKYLGEETIQEGRPSQRHPLEGHEYHKKSDEALVHIAKDAHAAAEAMKSHNTTAENKYRDQANDSATVRHYRKTSGMPDWYKKKYGHMKESFRPMDEPNYNNSIQARQKKADDANKPPFDGPYKKVKGDVKDKSGAIHTAQSMAKDAAHRGMQMAMKKKGIKESKQASIVRDAVKSAKDKKKAVPEDKFQADPVLSNSITRNV